MKRTKRIQGNVFVPTKYPIALQHVINHFRTRKEEARFTFETEEKATQVRFTWYNYVKALRAHGYEHDVAIADGIIVKKRGAVLIFGLRDEEPDYAGMEQQMREQWGQLPDAPLPMMETLQTEGEKAKEKVEREWSFVKKEEEPLPSDAVLMEMLFGKGKEGEGR